MARIGIFGVCGKMGARIARLALKDKMFSVTACIENKEHQMIGSSLGKFLETTGADITIVDDIKKSNIKEIDCVIDFTLPAGTIEHVAVCEELDIPMVIGTTGFDRDSERKIVTASENIPIVFSPNMATGVNVLFNIVREASRVLGNDFSIKIDETHHIHKKDSPSGTAKMIARNIEDACGKNPYIEVFREGEVIGNHGIIFSNEYETLEIRHDAKSRDVFAAGALKAARFIVNKPAGLYTMADVLGFKK
ncbi:dihydrodipicolinate reductase [Candidatus Omnitrophus magneticus]|uniref:4-hydroxy-tetrahydrodipicolinate reductase n=1 Tax=Candidatus Omnitrophus magneticus TaxID=1609969 RepID=A0A0F0CP02_9BACT|nr:dihydrodipicolinate reductase [Candidatus Omnitrophus magneticus]